MPAMKAIAAAVAHQNAMSRSCMLLPHGSRMFMLMKGWESDVVRNDPDTFVASTLLELEAALRDLSCKVVFLPLDAMMTDSDIERLCRRHGVSKTLFKETDVA